MSSYRQILNGLAYTQVTKQAYIPDFRLGVDQAEELGSVPILIFTDLYAPQQSPVIKAWQNMSFEELAPDLKGAKTKMENFGTTSFYLGDAVVGV
jgi:hypothetical protein